MPLIELTFYGVLGGFAGLVAGLLGVGGGLIIVPILAWYFQQQLGLDNYMHLAVGTSMATIVFTGLSSLWAHHRHGDIDWHLVRMFAPALMAGAVFGAWAASVLATRNLRWGFGIFELLIALQMFAGIRINGQRQLPGKSALAGFGFSVGSVSAMLGIGGGTMIVPFLNWCRIAMHRAISTSAACGFPIAIAGTLAYVLLGQDPLQIKAVGYVHLPALLSIAVFSVITAPFGAKLAKHMSAGLLRQTFATFLMALGVWVILGRA